MINLWYKNANCKPTDFISKEIGEQAAIADFHEIKTAN